MNYTFQMYKRWIFIFLCLFGECFSREKNKYLMVNDCHGTKNVELSDIHDLCSNEQSTSPSGSAVNVKTAGPEIYSLVQKVEIVETSAYRCFVSQSVFHVYCGTSSWAKLVAPPIILEPGQQLSKVECKRFIASKLYFKNQKSFPVSADNVLYLDSTTPKVWWDPSRNNWHCTGGEALIAGQRYSHLTVFKRVKIQGEIVTVRKIRTADGKYKIIDSNNNFELPSSCTLGHCTLSTMTYVMMSDLSNCYFKHIGQVELSAAPWNVFNTPLLVNSSKKIALLKKDPITTPEGCGRVGLFSTQFADVFLFKGDSKLDHIATSNIDLELEIRLLIFFEDVSSYSNLKFGLLNSKLLLCKLIVSGFHQTSLFLSGNHLVRQRGDVVEFVLCKKLNVSVRMGVKFDTCYTETFPVWVSGKLMFMDVKTRTLMKDPGLSRAPCDKKNLPIVRSTDGHYLIMDGQTRIIMVHVTPMKLLEDRNLLFEYKWSDSEPEFLYSHEDIKAWRNDLLIQSHQRAITAHIAREICHRADNCFAETYSDESLVKSTLASFMKEMSPMTYLQDILTKASYYGGLISLVMATLMVIKTITDIIVNLCRGRALRRVLYVLMCFHLFVHERLVDHPGQGHGDDAEVVRPRVRQLDVAPFPPRR